MSGIFSTWVSLQCQMGIYWLDQIGMPYESGYRRIRMRGRVMSNFGGFACNAPISLSQWSLYSILSEYRPFLRTHRIDSRTPSPPSEGKTIGKAVKIGWSRTVISTTFSVSRGDISELRWYFWAGFVSKLFFKSSSQRLSTLQVRGSSHRGAL